MKADMDCIIREHEDIGQTIHVNHGEKMAGNRYNEKLDINHGMMGD